MPTPAWAGSTSLIVQKNSGTLTLSDRSTGQDVYRGPGAACASGILARGTFGTGGRDGWVVTSSMSKRVESLGGDIWELTINWEAGGADATIPLPCDEFSFDPQDDWIRIERHPMFSGMDSGLVALAYQAVGGENYVVKGTSIDIINGQGDATQKALAQKLLSKLQKGEETFYLAYGRYEWTTFSYTLPAISVRGTLTAPGGPLATALSGFGNQLQLADGIESAGVNGSCFKWSQTWLVGPPGNFPGWDTDLY